jgi:aerobic-type carbon monoxide dehydrogenase small subunit (CoxS/CutS family)
MTFTLLVNGSERQLDVPQEETLLQTLRDRLELSGTKYGCGEGQCGACTVLVDGSPRRSCQITTLNAAGKRITTIEGLERGGMLHPVQQAFLDTEAFQCGYCTPGMILSAVALLEQVAHPSREAIVRHMQGNICRCGTYGRILEAIEQAASIRRNKSDGAAAHR